MILDFIRNKIVEVEPQPDGSVSVNWRLKDSLMDVNVKILIQTPELEIKEARAEMKRPFLQNCLPAQDRIEKIVGVRVGAGLRKIAAGLLGGDEGCDVLKAAVLESCNAAILHFTRYTLQAGDGLSDEEKLAGARANLEANPRMAGSCVVYAEGSPVMEGYRAGGGEG
ncbi:MAG: DUF2889 domain-containing protein [Deltaproteobacteria bacterium]|mgnify:CR=1 FL=1|nr:DUF2889 domain-containing protein [Deltaproteobacteria bacterium]MBW1924640.1 DUF2889 domain-containing protein [Deltaproteobacteria bacterium]MBW1948971.1 DUF2889 domain-containing protein [Deltaproteobacteria bacterium]MBW2009356.1 DUF2889 domain-containing protein [Deltaproteobacteria bacterium]MBW2104106.1 DUF2889 domain-containing protein [Deltaproteobacteria bacterium]